MLIDIHTHKKEVETGNVAIQNINLPDRICCCGLDLSLYYSLGIHPWKINPELLSSHLQDLEQQILFENIKAVGECGLDKLCDTPIELQEKAFLGQIMISEKYQKPIIIHCVKAFDELLSLKKKINPKQAWIIHGFRGNPQQMKQLLAHGFFFSFGLYFNEETLKQTPLERLFLETDDANVSIDSIYNKVSEVLRMEKEVLVDEIEKRFVELF